jgi:hypothetical protein
MSLWKRVLSERRVIVVPLLTALALNIVAFGLAVIPLSRGVTADETRATDVKLALAEANRMMRIAGDTRTSEDRAGQELQTFYAEVLPAGLSEARTMLFLELNKLAAETGVRFQKSSYELEDVDESSLTRFSTDVVLTGEYAGIRRFQYLLETSEHFFVVESVKVASSGRLQGAQSARGALEIVLTVVTYYNRLTTGAAQ